MAVIQMFPAQEIKKRLDQPPLVEASSPDDPKALITLKISDSTIEKLVIARRRSDLFEAWAHLVGEMPPVNNAELVRRTEHPNALIATLREAKLCFKGVKRPYDNDDDGACIYVYVIPTDYTVRWQNEMRTVAGVFPVPAGTVLTVHVRQTATLQVGEEGIWGIITKREFINADREQNAFPDGYGDRYDELLWQK